LAETSRRAKNTAHVPIRLKLASKFSSLAAVCAFVEGACKSLVPKLQANEIQNIQLAVNEACANIIRHAYENDNEKVFWLSADLEGDFLVFTTIDRGKTAEGLFSQCREPSHTTSEPAEHGYGIMLMKKVLDDIQYFYDEKRGNVLLMKKNVSSAGAPKEEAK